MLVDTHCHLGDARFHADRAAVVERAVAAGVGHCIVIADSASATEQAISLASRFGLSASAGIHPHEASSWTPGIADFLEESLNNPAVVALGETGLDYHYDFSPRETQREVFSRQLEIAERHGLPAVVHSRNADRDAIAIIRDSAATVILHSFCSGPDLLALALERGDYVSFSGMVTFNSWNDRDAVREVPEERILVETDAPYLAPVPHRGKRNEPSYVTLVAAKLAELRKVSLERIERETTENAIRCFGERVDPAR